MKKQLTEIAENMILAYGKEDITKQDFLPGISKIKIYRQENSIFVEIRAKGYLLEINENKMCIKFPGEVENIDSKKINKLLDDLIITIKSHTKLIVDEKISERILELKKQKESIDKELESLDQK